LGLDDLLGPSELLPQPSHLVLQHLDPARLGLGEIWLGSTPLGGERGLFAGLDFPAPVREMRAVQPFPAQQCTHLPRHLAGVGLAHDAALIRRRELPTLGQRRHFGIGRTADRDLHCIDFEQWLYLLVHGSSPFYIKLTKKGVSRYVDTGGSSIKRR
jgi:hypothetical protein